MYKICEEYADDLYKIYVRAPGKKLRPLSDFDLGEYYDFVRMIPYKIDKKPVEIIGRPIRLVQLGKLDCKKKSVMIGCYATIKNIPFRFVASSNRKSREIHHVFPELYICGEWISYDATYPEYHIGMEKKLTRREVLS